MSEAEKTAVNKNSTSKPSKGFSFFKSRKLSTHELDKSDKREDNRAADKKMKKRRSSFFGFITGKKDKGDDEGNGGGSPDKAGGKGKGKTLSRDDRLSFSDSSTDLLSAIECAVLLRMELPSSKPPMTLSGLVKTPLYIMALETNAAAIERAEKHVGSEHPGVKKRKIATASLYKALGMLQESAELLEEVMVSMKKQQEALHEEELALVLNELALVYIYLEKYKVAEEYLHEAIELFTSFHKGVNPDVAVALGNIASALYCAKDYQRALPFHERAIKMIETHLGKDHEETAFQRGNMALTLMKCGEGSRAKRILKEIIPELEKAGYKSNHVWLSNYQNALAA